MPFALEKRRNIGIMAHIDAGKTTVTERILYYSGKTYKMGNVDEGTTVTDWMAEEQRRGITISAAAVTCHWRDCEINLIDTPGHVDFTAEVERSLRVLDGAIAVLCGVGGVEAQTETVWRQADKYRVPRIVFVNKLDRIGSDFHAAVTEVIEKLRAFPLVLQIPVGSGREFKGVVDLVEMRAMFFDPEELGKRVVVADIPAELRQEAERRREELIERVGEKDDAVMKEYVEGRRVPPDVLRAGIRRLTIRSEGVAYEPAVPVLCGSALNYQGIQPLLDSVCDYLPSPVDVGPVRGKKPGARHGDENIERKPSPDEPFCALAFKIAFDRYDNLTYMRVYSGAAREGSRVLNPRTGKRERLRQIYRLLADKREEEEREIGPGDIVGVLGLESTVTGDTLCDIGRPILLEHLEFPDTVISMAIEPKSQAEKDKLADVLARLVKEDPTLSTRIDPETGQLVISGMGELHLEVVKNRMIEEFNVGVNVGALRVAYKETIAKPVEETAEFIQSRAGPSGAGRGQFARVTLRVEREKAAGKVIFDNQLKSGPSHGRDGLDKQYLKAVEAGVRETAMGGIVSGYPLINIRATLIDAEERAAESSELAFNTAASMALRRAVEKAGIKLLEPIMKLEVVMPDEYLGEVVKDLRARRGQLQHMGERSGMRVITARVPLAELFGYATALRSLTRGRGTHTMEPCDYEEAPKAVFDRLVGFIET